MKKSDIRSILTSLKSEDLTQDEAISKILDLTHAESDALKDRIDELTEENKGLKDSNSNEWESKYNSLNEEYGKYKADQEALASKSAKSEALKALLKTAGLSEKGQEKAAKYTSLDSVEIGKDGQIKGADKLIEAIKAEWAEYAEESSSSGASTSKADAVGGSGSKKMSMAEIYAKDENGKYKLSTAERQKLVAENLAAENS
jgi:hypothetical protein